MRHGIVIDTEDAQRIARFLRPGLNGSDAERAACYELRQRMRQLLARYQRMDIVRQTQNAERRTQNEDPEEWEVTAVDFNIEWHERR